MGGEGPWKREDAASICSQVKMREINFPFFFWLPRIDQNILFFLFPAQESEVRLRRTLIREEKLLNPLPFCLSGLKPARPRRVGQTLLGAQGRK